MSERIVSPGVFTRENDLSFLTQGISEIGGAFIGPTPKGPAFIPTIVRSQQEYVTRFGDADASHYTGLTVKNYLREAGVATVVRVLGLNGYTGATPALLFATGSTGKKLFAVLHPSTIGETINSVSVAGNTGSFNLVLDVVGTNADVSASNLSPLAASPAYFVDALGTAPTTKKGAYVYSVFPEAISQVGNSAIFEIETSSVALNFAGAEYSYASTPWIVAQNTGSLAGTRLFKLNTLSDGVSANTEIKVSLLNMKLGRTGEYGTFSLIIRKFDDTDTRIQILEQYDNLTFNPDSPNFIARVLGNSAPTEDNVTGEMYYQGDFPNQSQYVWVEMDDQEIPVTALPCGFEALYAPVSVSSSFMVTPTYVESRWLSGSTPGFTTESVDKKYYYGWEFGTYETTNYSFLAPVPATAVPAGLEFNLLDLADVPSGSTSKSIDLNDDDSFNYRRFTIPFQGGFDGLNPARKIALGNDILDTNSQGFDLSGTTSAGYLAYKKALDALSNPDNFDFNILVTPGIIRQLHSAVSDRALEVCESRQDAFYIMDTTKWDATIVQAVSQAATIDTNYAGTYYPWIRVLDSNTNKLLWVPPSVVLPEVFAFSDNAAAEWYAVAGLNRGGIPSAVGVKVRLPQPSRDTLYEGKVNPIAQFPGQGIVVWGQKTLQDSESALDRINVRRLLIAVKKYIASSSRYLVFEQNIETTRNRFLNIVNPYLAGIQERSGLYAFRVIMDDTNNTSDVVDRNVLYGQLYLQPTKTAEFIILDFNVLPTGAIFPTA